MDYHVYLQQSLLAMVERLGGTEKITVIELHHSVDEIGYVLDQLVELCNMVCESLMYRGTNLILTALTISNLVERKAGVHRS
jgi:hypothetical protein